MKEEGLIKRGKMVGDPMYDAFLSYHAKSEANKFTLKLLDGGESNVPAKFYYMTCHREENTNDDTDLSEILGAMDQLDSPVIYPVHPRNKQRAIRLNNKHGYRNIILTEPVGYLESIYLVNHALKIVTDSGGLQREAFFAGKQCVTILDFVCWPETMVDNRNQLARPETEDIIEKLSKTQTVDLNYQPFGDGHSAVRIVKAIEEYEQ